MIHEILSLIEEAESYIVNHKSGKSSIKTEIPPEKRELSNLPRDSKGKARVRFQDWLLLKTIGNSLGQGANSKWYGWSHRAIHGFFVGEKVKKGTIGHNTSRGEEYIIKDDKDAKDHAKRFAREVS